MRQRRTRAIVALFCASLLANNVAGAQHAAGVSPASNRLVLSALVAGGPETSAKCGLPAIAAALAHRGTLTPAQSAALQSVLQRPLLQKQITRGRFTIHYDTSAASVNTPALLDPAYQRMPGTADAFAESVAVNADFVWSVEVGQMGYAAPPGDGTAGGGPEFDIYIQELGDAYGETTPEIPLDTKPNGGRYISFITIDNDYRFVQPASNKGLPGLRVTLAHEFHHAIQLGSYGFWQTDQYFYEITSTWCEDVVYPDVNDYLLYVRSSTGHFAVPSASFTSNGLIMYSRSIWAEFVAKRFGPRVMRRAWELMPAGPPLVSMDAALKETGSSMRAAFLEWALWNYYTAWRSDSAYYADGILYPSVTQGKYAFTPPARAIQQNTESLSARYLQVQNGSDTTTLIVVNLNASAAAEGAFGPYPFTLRLRDIGDEGFEPAGAGLYERLEAADPSNWKVWTVESTGPRVADLSAGVPFPQPFRADGRNVVQIPAPATAGRLLIFAGDMELVFSENQTARTLMGTRVFWWDGNTSSGGRAGSGVYFFILEVPGRVFKGKIFLVRK